MRGKYVYKSKVSRILLFVGLGITLFSGIPLVLNLYMWRVVIVPGLCVGFALILFSMLFDFFFYKPSKPGEDDKRISHPGIVAVPVVPEMLGNGATDYDEVLKENRQKICRGISEEMLDNKMLIARELGIDVGTFSKTDVYGNMNWNCSEKQQENARRYFQGCVDEGLREFVGSCDGISVRTEENGRVLKVYADMEKYTEDDVREVIMDLAADCVMVQMFDGSSEDVDFTCEVFDMKSGSTVSRWKFGE